MLIRVSLFCDHIIIIIILVILVAAIIYALVSRLEKFKMSF